MIPKNRAEMKSKVDKPVTNGAPNATKTKAKEDRKRAKTQKSEADSQIPAKILKKSKKEKPAETEEKENTASNANLKVSQINKAVFVVFKKMQGSQLTKKMINSLITLLRDDTNAEQVGPYQLSK